MEKTEVTNKPKETEPTIVFEVTREDEPKKIKGEISIEVIGEDEPTKYDKRRERWAMATACSLVIWLITLACACFVELNICLFVISGVSFAVFLFSFCNCGKTYPEEPQYWNTPWGFWL